MNDASLPKSVTTVIDLAHTDLNKEDTQNYDPIKVAGILLAVAYGLFRNGRKPKRKKGEGEGSTDYLDRLEEAHVDYFYAYLVDYSEKDNIPDFLAIYRSDSQLHRFYMPHPKTSDNLRRRLYWRLHHSLYRPLFRRFSLFERKVILLDDIKLLPALERTVGPYLPVFPFLYNLPVEVTGTLTPSTDPLFPISLSDIKEIRLLEGWKQDRDAITIKLNG